MKEINLNNETVLKIVNSAVELFNIYGYAGTSISDISKKAQLSKGILYHYFKNKDDLYLFCAAKCINEYIAYLDENLQSPSTQTDAIAENVKARIQFFEEYPQYRTLFSFITSKKPTHLADELTEIRKTLTESNTKRLMEITNHAPLGKGITPKDILTFTSILQNNSAFLVQDFLSEEQKAEQIETLVRLAKIFINGLKYDVE